MKKTKYNNLIFKDMNIKVFLLSVCLGSATAAPAEIYTAQPFKIVSQLLSAGNSIYHVTIKSI